MSKGLTNRNLSSQYLKTPLGHEWRMHHVNN